jgi:transposase
MEAPMRKRHFIGIDVHSQFCEIAVLGPTSDEVVLRERCAPTIPELLAVLAQVKRPCSVVIEEGPMAGWLWRHLHGEVDAMVVSEPRRNRLVAKDGDKDDDIDAEKLALLHRGGFIKEVHQVASLDQAVFKQCVAAYHYRVRQRVRDAHRLTFLFRQHGIVIREKSYVAVAERPALVARLPAQTALAQLVAALWASYDDLVKHEEEARQRLVRLARQLEIVRRFEELPGLGWIRAATLYAYLDTPWRFRSKAALWKYLGIGLERKRSGSGPEYLGVPKRTHRLLKNTILGAAQSAAAQGDNPFADLHRRWRAEGLTWQLARRNVARRLAATLWGLWKNSSVYHPEWVAKAVAASTAAPVSR